MVVSKSEAAGALRDIEQAQNRVGEMRGYRIAGPYLIGWGLIWAIGYVLMALRPMTEWGLIWLPLDLVGIGVSIIAGIRGNRAVPATGPGNAATWRVIVGVLFIAAYIAATYMLFAPHDVRPFLLYPGMVVGAIYVMMGLACLPRLGWIGAAIFLLTVAGLFIPRDFLLYWMAAVGGGGLMLSGAWLRTA
jgi:hypothetical protein